MTESEGDANRWNFLGRKHVHFGLPTWIPLVPKPGAVVLRFYLAHLAEEG